MKKNWAPIGTAGKMGYLHGNSKTSNYKNLVCLTKKYSAMCQNDDLFFSFQ